MLLYPIENRQVNSALVVQDGTIVPRGESGSKNSGAQTQGLE